MLEPSARTIPAAIRSAEDLSTIDGRGLERLVRALIFVALGLAVSLTYQTLYGQDGLPLRARLTADLASVRDEQHRLRLRLASLQRDIAAQKDRPLVQEALVRDVLGYVRPGEIVLQPRP